MQQQSIVSHGRPTQRPEVRHLPDSRCTFRETTEVQTQSLSQGYTEVGGLSLKSLRFSIRDRNGLPVPMENGEWSAQLVFGFPSA